MTDDNSSDGADTAVASDNNHYAILSREDESKSNEEVEASDPPGWICRHDEENDEVSWMHPLNPEIPHDEVLLIEFENAAPFAADIFMNTPGQGYGLFIAKLETLESFATPARMGFSYFVTKHDVMEDLYIPSISASSVAENDEQQFKNHLLFHVQHRAQKFIIPSDAAPLAADEEYLKDKLPSGWVEIVDPSTENTYYFNEENGMDTWERPHNNQGDEATKSKRLAYWRAKLSEPSERNEVISLETLIDTLKIQTNQLTGGNFPEERSGFHYFIFQSALSLGEWAALDSHDTLINVYWERLADALMQNPKAPKPERWTFSQVKLPPVILLSSLHVRNIESLYLERNELDHNDIAFLCQHLEKNQDLKFFGIVRNNLAKMGDLTNFFNVIRDHQSLGILCMNDMNLGRDEGVLTKLLDAVANLRAISLNANSIDSEVLAPIANFLTQNCPLRELDLRQNTLNDHDMELVAKALAKNTNLCHLNLEITDVTAPGRNTIYKALFDHSSLNKLADSNHTCCVVFDKPFGKLYNPNGCRAESKSKNKKWKILLVLLASDEMQLVKYMEDLPIALMPYVLEILQQDVEDIEISMKTGVLNLFTKERNLLADYHVGSGELPASARAFFSRRTKLQVISDFVRSVYVTSFFTQHRS